MITLEGLRFFAFGDRPPFARRLGDQVAERAERLALYLRPEQAILLARVAAEDLRIQSRGLSIVAVFRVAVLCRHVCAANADHRQLVAADAPREHFGLAGGGGGGFGAQQQNVRGQLGQVKGQLMGSTSMPTQQQVRIAGELRADMEKVVADTNALVAAIPAIYDAMGASGAKPTALKPIGPLPAAR